MLLSRKKAETLATRYSKEVILTADTIISCKGKLYNEGCYYNVLGLPVNTVQKLLLMLEIDLWKQKPLS